MTTEDERPDQPHAAEKNTDGDPEKRPETSPEARPEAAQPEAPQASKSRRKGAGALFLLALLPGLAALAWLAWLHFAEDDAAGDDPTVALNERLTELAAQFQAQDDRITRQESAGQTLQSDLDGIDLDPLTREVDAVQRDLSGVERRVGQQLQRFGERLDESKPAPDMDQRIVLTEAAALLRMGADRLELAGNVNAARQAYARAAAVLENSEDPRLATVQRQLAREREALANWQLPDWAALAGRLRALSEQAADWPMEAAAVDEPERPDEPRSWRGRAWRVLDSLITIRRSEGDQLTSNEAEDLRWILQTRLVAAELEAARHDADALATALEPVADALEQYFDGSDSAVQAALESIADIKIQARGDELPALGDAARQLQTLAARDR